MDDIVILDGCRTAIGTFGGALAGTPPTKLGDACDHANRILYSLRRADVLPHCLLILTTTNACDHAGRIPETTDIPGREFFIPSNIPKCPTFSSSPIQT